jgi:SNF2 family DNA or RNA helicase
MSVDFVDLLRKAYTDETIRAQLPTLLDFTPVKTTLSGVPLKEEYTAPDGETRPLSLDDYQVDTVRWMMNQTIRKTTLVQGGMLHLTQGLGKTITTLVFALANPVVKANGKKLPSLIVASKTLMYEWHDQIKQFFGDSVKVLYFHREIVSDYVDTVQIPDFEQYDLVVTTYDVLIGGAKRTGLLDASEDKQTNSTGHSVTVQKTRSEMGNFYEQKKIEGAACLFHYKWGHIVCDESQRFANTHTKMYRTVIVLDGHYKWCLSGTPTRNYSTDIWAQLRFMDFKSINNAGAWSKRAAFYFRHYKLSTEIYSKTYRDVGCRLPMKHEFYVFTTMGERATSLYNFIRHTALGMLNGVAESRLVIDGKPNTMCVLAMITRLRQVCIAPYLLTEEAMRNKKKTMTADELEWLEKLKAYEKEHDMFGGWMYDKEGTSGMKAPKIQEIVGIVRNIVSASSKDKIIVYSSYTSTLDLLAETMDVYLPGVNYIMIDGEVTGHSRRRYIKMFQQNKNLTVLLMTYKVGSEGLNLTQSAHCICMEPWWTDAVHNQAKARIYRRGQEKEVHIYNILSTMEHDPTIEDRVMEICAQKNGITNSLISSSTPRMTAGMMRRMLS